jgi:hypothetical protein
MKPSRCLHNNLYRYELFHHDAARLKVGDLIALAKRITGDRPTNTLSNNFVIKTMWYSMKIALPMVCGGVLPNNI